MALQVLVCNVFCLFVLVEKPKSGHSVQRPTHGDSRGNLVEYNVSNIKYYERVSCGAVAHLPQKQFRILLLIATALRVMVIVIYQPQHLTLTYKPRRRYGCYDGLGSIFDGDCRPYRGVKLEGGLWDEGPTRTLAIF